MDRRLYKLINPSDPITFRATVEEAAFIADRMRAGLYFVKDTETGETPAIPDMEASYEALWKNAERLASYAQAYRSFLVGSRSERELFEKVVERMTPAEAETYRHEYHNKRCTSLNDICRQCWEAADKIAGYEPEAVAS